MSLIICLCPLGVTGRPRQVVRSPVWPVSWLSFQSLYQDTVHALEDLLAGLLRRDMTPQGLQVMVEVCGG